VGLLLHADERGLRQRHVSESDEHTRCPSLHVRVHRRLRLFERAGRQRRHGARRRMCSRSYPGVTLKGVELVPTRIGVGETKRSVTVGQIELGRGEARPFPTAASTSSVRSAFCTMVRHPKRATAEMTLARHAIFLSEINPLWWGQPRGRRGQAPALGAGNVGDGGSAEDPGSRVQSRADRRRVLLVEPL
jgi:hypothetical protein